MAAIDIQRRGRGGAVIAASALLGALGSVYKYFSEASGIEGTPGAMLVIVTSIMLFFIGVIFARQSAGSTVLRVMSGACLILIVGTAFAAYLLESHVLTALMFVCFLGWAMHALRRPIAVAPV